MKQSIDHEHDVYGYWDQCNNYQFMVYKPHWDRFCDVYFMDGSDYGGGICSVYRVPSENTEELEQILATHKDKSGYDLKEEVAGLCREYAKPIPLETDYCKEC